MKKQTLAMCVLVLFAISACTSVRPAVIRYQKHSGKTGAMMKDGKNSFEAAPTGCILLFEAPQDYALNPTVGNAHLRRCIRKEANKLCKAVYKQPVVQELRYNPIFVENRKVIMANLEPGRIGIEVLNNGEEVYAKFDEFTEIDADHACENFRELRGAAQTDLVGSGTLARNDRTAPAPRPDPDGSDDEGLEDESDDEEDLEDLEGLEDEDSDEEEPVGDDLEDEDSEDDELDGLLDDGENDSEEGPVDEDIEEEDPVDEDIEEESSNDGEPEAEDFQIE